MREELYYNNPFYYSRFLTREVYIGDIPLGGSNPIRIQSMTNTKTLDTESTVQQTILLAEAGCDYVRITAQNIKEAENLKSIKQKLKEKGYSIPLIADIHFNPEVAKVAARFVEKVRINPGNFVDRNILKDSESAIFEKIRENIAPLINICKIYGTAIRIGSNCGSLSQRILEKYGNTPLGMVEAALEFVRIFKDLDFNNLVLAMKASDVKIMIYATRLLVSKMKSEGFNYPIHLGVTEAGEGEDGIIKSAAGIGAMLEDGIGDTIRVSLTGDPIIEIPVAKAIVQRINQLRITNYELRNTKHQIPSTNLYEYNKRKTYTLNKIGGTNFPIIVQDNIKGFSDVDIKDYEFIQLESNELSEDIIEKLKADSSLILICCLNSETEILSLRKVFYTLIQNHIETPVIIKRRYKNINSESFKISSAIDFASILIDGFGDGIWIETDDKINSEEVYQTGLNILQALGLRYSKAIYISCPTCGRTNYNINEALNQIKLKTSHLKGVKIAVMGCIVNGPGEMADADYGYVGSGLGKVTLYKGKNIVKKNIDEKLAIDELLKLINSEK